MAPGTSFRMSALTLSSASSRRLMISTAAPSSVSSLALAEPIEPEPPVMNAVFPANDCACMDVSP